MFPCVPAHTAVGPAPGPQDTTPAESDTVNRYWGIRKQVVVGATSCKPGACARIAHQTGTWHTSGTVTQVETHWSES